MSDRAVYDVSLKKITPEKGHENIGADVSGSVICRWEPGKVYTKRLGRVANMSIGNTNSSKTLSEFSAGVQRIEFILPTVRHQNMW